MSKVKACLINNVYSFSNLTSTNTKITDLRKTSLYISNATNPRTTHLHLGKCRVLDDVRKEYCGIVTCRDFQSFQYIVKSMDTTPDIALSLLLKCFDRSVNVVFVLLNTNEYISRSIKINMSWCRKMWSLSSRAHFIAVTGVYYSVLGGAYCSLGKSNTKYAYKAGALAIEQIKLAQRLKDPILECKCWLYFAEDLIQLGRLKTAENIIARQTKFVESIKEPTLMSMLASVVGKLKFATNTKMYQE